ncbi:MAG: tRNA guanosine(34) transglycosylase Tgt [Deltaproteobacteria bacterium]|nr:tRNA guanosine(34) transglycosylase Tgt [Deltaproteobacteria bacterium]MBK9366063.1 tRNA guanosine(34) transglycosylase Tgt [Deltaproteobacteria bacterium]MBK9647933.1 tRNA guanosine(34) transglycosylase Tgt [Deltaproteobacteria bacterium]
MSLPFKVEARSGAARAGVLTTARGSIRTPVYMPVGTQGAIRTLAPSLIPATGTQILLANTYHLHQRPGEELVAKHGGLHKMMGVNLPILTDSGGFQVFSLDKKKVDEQGVTFTYEVDGQRTFLSPESSMAIQMALGADIAMVFDECLAYGTDRAYAEASVARTTRWEQRSKAAHTRPDQALFGIVQGGFWADLRKRSAEEIQEIGFDGYAIGGLSVGEGHDVMCQVLDWTTPHMPQNHPRYLMGVGKPIDLVEGVARGIDMFDCVIQTRHARSGMFYTRKGRMRITDARFRKDMYPPDTSCSCYTCRTFTRAYIHHLFRVGEVLGATLATLHNIHFFAAFMDEMRQSILEGRFEAFRKEVHATWEEKPQANSVRPMKPGKPHKKAKAEALDDDDSFGG